MASPPYDDSGPRGHMTGVLPDPWSTGRDAGQEDQHELDPAGTKWDGAEPDRP
jgi:hypothetical protein